MSFLEYDTENNIVSVVKAPSRFRNYLTRKQSKHPGINILEKDGEFKGVEVENFLSEIEVKGFKAEQLFKEILEKNEIPSLYIGQGPSGIEYSETLKNSLKSNRPDFLVNFPDIGSLFFDVKCRKKIGFNTEDTSLFYLFESEANALINLHEQLLIPVWVAFLDSDLLENNGDKNTVFHLLPISLLKKLKNGLQQNVTRREYGLICTYRIPLELLTPVEDIFSFNVGFNSVPEEIIDFFSKKYKGLIRRIEDEIKLIIRNKKILKSKISDMLIENHLEFAFKLEIDNILEELIKEKTVIFEKNQPLKLLGED